MTYQSIVNPTHRQIISEILDHADNVVIRCEECMDYIEDGDEYWEIEGEILCDSCARRRYQRRNRGSMF